MIFSTLNRKHLLPLTSLMGLLIALLGVFAARPQTVDAADPNFSTITWSDTGVVYNPGIAEGQSIVVNGKMYIFGGFVGNGIPTRKSRVFDPVANTVTPIADMPKGLTHGGYTTDGTNIFYAGGYIENATQTGQVFGAKDVYRYNVASNTYTALPGLPEDRAAGQLVYLDGKLHYVSGTNKARTVDVGDHYVLDLNDLNAGWDTLAPLPNPRHHGAMKVYGGYIYYIGGQHDHDGALVPQNDVHRYNPANNTWEQMADMPGNGRNHHGFTTLIVGDRFLVLAGQSYSGIEWKSVLAYTPATNTWETLPDMNYCQTPANPTVECAQHSAIAGLIDGVIYFGTGSENHGQDDRKKIYKGVLNVIVPPTETPIPGTATTVPPTNTPAPPTNTPDPNMTATFTAVPPTATSTIVASTDVPGELELLVNGGFDMLGIGARDLTPWVVKKGTSDEIKCNKTDKLIAQAGECAFQFKGGGDASRGLPETTKLMQKVNLATTTFAAGDLLNFSFYAKAKGDVVLKAKAVVEYANDSLPKTKTTVEITPTSGVYQVAERTLLLTSGNIDQIKVMFKNKSASGKAWVDSVSLSLLP
jgi:N-acetylneuraminic acid mutarotase